MSKMVKEMEFQHLQNTFAEVEEAVLLDVSGVSVVDENAMRLELRKKDILLHRVKNSLAARVFSVKGVSGLDEKWNGPTTVAWGSSSLADLSKEIDRWAKKFSDKFLPKAAITEGAVVTFEEAKKFPTREEAIARICGLALAPASRLVGQICGPASQLASQIKSIGEGESKSE